MIVSREDGTEEHITLADLRRRVGAAQDGLRRLGVGAGDRVAALVPNGIHALVGFLATAALAAVWSSCSPDFGPGSVIDRFTQISPTVLLAVDGYRYGGKSFAITATVEQLRAALPGLAGAVHIPALGTTPPDGMTGWDDFVSRSRRRRLHPGAVRRAAVGAVFVGHHRAAQADRPVRRRDPAGAPEIRWAAMRTSARATGSSGSAPPAG